MLGSDETEEGFRLTDLRTDARRHPLVSCWLRLARAEELIEELRRGIEKVKGGNYIKFDISGFAVNVTERRPIPVHQWGVLVGEIVHDLRSSLDHMTWAVSVAYGSPPREPLDASWRAVEFPIFTGKAVFYETDGRGRPTPRSGLRDLYHVDPNIVARFDQLQPFHHTRPERHPLAILHGISIHDKHRAPPLVAIAGRRQLITAEAPEHGLRGTSRARRVPLPIDGMATIASLRTLKGTLGRPLAEGDTVKIYGEFLFDFEFGFASGPPAFGGELIATLRRLHSATQRAIRYLGEGHLYESP